MFLFCPQLTLFLNLATDRNVTNPTGMLLSSAKVLAVEFVIWEKAVILMTNVFAVYKSFCFYPLFTFFVPCHIL